MTIKNTHFKRLLINRIIKELGVHLKIWDSEKSGNKNYIQVIKEINKRLKPLAKNEIPNSPTDHRLELEEYLKIAAKYVEIDSKKQGVPWQCLVLNAVRLKLVGDAENMLGLRNKKLKKSLKNNHQKKRNFLLIVLVFSLQKMKRTESESESEKEMLSNKEGN